MSKLQQFLTGRNVTELTEDVAISDRLKDEEGKLLKFKIKAMTADEFSNIQKVCTRVDKKQKVNFNSKLYNEELITNYCLEPDFKNAQFLKDNGCMSPSQLINKVLLAGEVSALSEAIAKLSGFDQDMDELKEEAKN